jgi:hypothetical protein
MTTNYGPFDRPYTDHERTVAHASQLTLKETRRRLRDGWTWTANQTTGLWSEPRDSADWREKLIMLDARLEVALPDPSRRDIIDWVLRNSGMVPESEKLEAIAKLWKATSSTKNSIKLTLTAAELEFLINSTLEENKHTRELNKRVRERAVGKLYEAHNASLDDPEDW